MALYPYRVYYHCPRCAGKHGLDTVITVPNPALHGHPLIDLYDGDAARPEIVAILGEILHCVNNRLTVVSPTLEQFFLEEAH